MAVTSDRTAEQPPRDDEGTLRDRVDFFVYYEDTDFSGFVYHANFLKFFERAREHLIGIDALKRWYLDGVHFVVSKALVDFHAPARHGDKIAILSDVQFSRSPRLPFNHEAWLVENGALTKKLVSGFVHIVALNREHRPLRLPDALIAHFRGKTHDPESDRPDRL